ncbi:hypothetical protein FSP39_005649 [Pinctada imbricata]|uniref:S5 DRBM domain-containing protein n=1 Tax=Pinctada imbricata TaxID=66713 RepID=A0AA88YAG6_PINIB|nr:hypothetical protein FSP39_005649 [Pinctada imbricata]
MTKIGRVTGFRALVAVGNGNGVGGYGLANSVDSNQAIHVAKLRAFNRLYFVERYNGHTRFGVVGSLVIKDLCYLLGIKDIYVKTEGARKNYRHVVRGFFEGLLDQETHQQLADRTNLYVVEVRDDRGNFPVVVASPSGDEVREALQGDEDEWLNVDSMYSGGKIKLKTKRKVPMYELNNYPSWKRRCQAVEKRRGQFEARWERYASGLEPSEEELKERFVPKPKNN